MNKAYLIPFVFAAALSAGAADPVYTNLLTGVASVTEQGVPTATGGAWSVNDATLSKVGETAFEFETAADPMTLDVTAAPADTNTIVRVELLASVADFGNLMDTLPSGAQTAFAVSTNSYNAWNGSEWVALNEVPAGVDDSQPTNLTVEISYQGTTPAHKRTARFWIGDTLLTVRTNGSAYVELATSADGFTGLGLNGAGTLAKADASVMLGVAEYDGVKYGTLSDAIAKAQTDVSAVKPAISVLRETSENVSVTGDGVSIADNGKVTGTIAVDPAKTVEVRPLLEEFVPADVGAVVGTSGSYTIPVKVSGGTVTVKLLMNNKEVVSVSEPSGAIVSLTIQTATSVLAGAKPDGTKALTNNVAGLRTYLGNHTNAAYIAANVSSESIQSALAATRENGLPLYQSYALGITPDADVKPVHAADDVDSGYITLSIPNLVGKAGSGDYTIKYKVGDTEQSGAGAIKIPLATGSNAVKIVFE